MRKPRLLDTVEPNANRRRDVRVSGNRVSAHGVSEHGVSRRVVDAPRGDTRAGTSLGSIVVIGARRHLTGGSASSVTWPRPGDAGVRTECTAAAGSPGNGTPAGAIHRAPDWHPRLSSQGVPAPFLAIVRDGELSSRRAVPQAAMRVVL
jgi:hypothetical protein